MKPCAEALEWAGRNGFDLFASAETIVAAYQAHLRLIAKIAARWAT